MNKITKNILRQHGISERTFRYVRRHYPCCKNALNTSKLKELFDIYKSKACVFLYCGILEKRSLHLKKVKHALHVGLLDGMVPYPKPKSFQTVQLKRLRGQKLAEEFGSWIIDDISELDLWWLHLQIKSLLPKDKDNYSYHIGQLDFVEFKRLRKKIDSATLVNFRKMIWTVKEKRGQAFSKTFDFGWRFKTNQEVWTNSDHPLNKFLLENLSSSLYHKYFQGFEKHPRLTQKKKKQLLEMIKTEKNKKETLPPLLPIFEPTLEARQKYACCLDATETKDLQELMDFQPDSWVNWLEQEAKNFGPGESIREFLKCGFYPKTIPKKLVSYRTMQRHRNKARVFFDLLPARTNLFSVDEYLLWFLHLETVALGKHQKLTENDLKTFRKMIHTLQRKHFSEYYSVLPSFDWDWRKKKDCRRYNAHKELDIWLRKNEKHPAQKKYSQGAFSPFWWL